LILIIKKQALGEKFLVGDSGAEKNVSVHVLRNRNNSEANTKIKAQRLTEY